MLQYTVDKVDFNVLRIDLDSTNKTNLIVAAGFSSDSFKGTSSIIIQTEHIAFLKQKYRSIYIIDYSIYKSDQKKACEIRDEKIARGIIDKGDIYKSESDLNKKIAKTFHKLITEKLNITSNIELLGKCAGAGVMLELTAYNTKLYNTLYFAVPGIPFSIEKLFSYSKQRLSKMKFVFGWVKQDEYLYHWGIKSCDEKKMRYEPLMAELEGMKKISIDYNYIMDDNSLNGDSKKYHEISTSLIKQISIIP